MMFLLQLLEGWERFQSLVSFQDLCVYEYVHHAWIAAEKKISFNNRFWNSTEDTLKDACLYVLTTLEEGKTIWGKDILYVIYRYFQITHPIIKNKFSELINLVNVTYFLLIKNTLHFAFFSPDPFTLCSDIINKEVISFLETDSCSKMLRYRCSGKYFFNCNCFIIKVYMT